jgi:hypothetical protein
LVTCCCSSSCFCANAELFIQIAAIRNTTTKLEIMNNNRIHPKFN